MNNESVREPSIRIGVDTGGTFTDLMVMDSSGKLKVFKVMSTPSEPSSAILRGLDRVLNETDQVGQNVSYFIHGTTVGTNAILEGKGSPVALLTTKGFRDVLHIARQERPVMFDFFVYRPEPLVPRYLRYEVSERVYADGHIRVPLDEEGVRSMLREASALGVRSVAVCFLHSYANQTHEKRVGEIVAQEFPHLSVTLSSEIVKDFKEYERMSTAVLNSYIQPIVGKYMDELQSGLRATGVHCSVLIMQSNGGVMTAGLATQKSINTVLSGPAGGAIAALQSGKAVGQDNIIGIDMGGTSLDVSLTYQGRLSFVSESDIGGYVVKLPMIGIHTLGAGGGSIAWIDSGGGLRVGPHSAGASPGPVCYGMGGKEPTVTDANLVLGRLGNLLGGEMSVSIEGARKAITEHIAKPLGLTLEEAAEGIIRVVNAQMSKGMRYVSLERGYDPREFTFLAFGGAGPVHASELAVDLGIPTVLVPPAPGAHSALGLLLTDIRHDYSRTVMQQVSSLDPDFLAQLQCQMAFEAVEQLQEEGVDQSRIVPSTSADVRYIGQGFELSVNLPSGPITKTTLTFLEKAYHDLHQQCYGFCKPNEPTELVNFRLVALGLLDKPNLPSLAQADCDPLLAVQGSRRVYFKGSWLETPLYNRSLLSPGMALQGPAIVEQLDSTTVIWPNQTASVDALTNLVLMEKS